MKNYFEKIKKKLSSNISLENIEIIDNSYKHAKHKSFLPGKLHLHVIIRSEYLKSITKISAHKLVMKTLQEDLKTKIHALEISLK